MQKFYKIERLKMACFIFILTRVFHEEILYARFGPIVALCIGNNQVTLAQIPATYRTTDAGTACLSLDLFPQNS